MLESATMFAIDSGTNILILGQRAVLIRYSNKSWQVRMSTYLVDACHV